MEAFLALPQATTAAADAHQLGAMVVVERLVGAAVLVLADVHLVGEEAVVAAHPGGEETADARLTAAVMAVVQLMVEQQRMVALHLMAVRHPMVEARHMAATMVIAPHMAASTLADVHLAGEALAQATQLRSLI